MGKKAIVTGGSSGIGRGIVYCLADAGYDIAFSYNSHALSADAVLHSIQQAHPGGKFYSFKAQLSDPGAGPVFFRQAVTALGGLDLMVNNAGISPKEGLLELTDKTLDELLLLNFRNYIVLMREAARYMASHGIKGSIINISSTRADRAYPTDGIYGAIKAGLNRAIQSFALDVAPYRIRINNVAPGAIQRQTSEEMAHASDNPQHAQLGYLEPRIPLGRVGRPDDVARAVLFLASDDAEYITGQTLKVDGGLTLPGMPERPELAALGWGTPEKKKIVWED